MVNTGLIRQKLINLSEFYKEVQDSSKEGWDLEKAQYAQKETQVLINLIDKNPGGLKNKDLKRLHSGFMNLTRGVECFMDYEIEKKHREVSKGIYDIQQDLEANIKW